jgi:MFS family permease
MAGVWCVATVLCGLSQNHAQMLMARAAVGVGEAGYGSVGAAMLTSAFPAARMSAVLGAFQAAAVFGTVLGVIAGGVIGAAHGWQAAFIWVGAGSLLLVMLFAVVAREAPRAGSRDSGPAAPRPRLGTVVRDLLSTASARYTYVGSGLQLLIIAAIGAWTPSFLAREYGLAADQAGTRAGLLIMMTGVGMIVGGAVADRFGRTIGRRKLHLASVYTCASFVLLAAAFALPTGSLQMGLLFVGALAAGGHAGVVAAVIVDVTHPALRATAIATLALSNNLLGLAPGPYVVGALSDALGLKTALTIMPVAGLFASVCFLIAARSHARDAAANALRSQAGIGPGPLDSVAR